MNKSTNMNNEQVPDSACCSVRNLGGPLAGHLVFIAMVFILNTPGKTTNSRGGETEAKKVASISEPFTHPAVEKNKIKEEALEEHLNRLPFLPGDVVKIVVEERKLRQVPSKEGQPLVNSTNKSVMQEKSKNKLSGIATGSPRSAKPVTFQLVVRECTEHRFCMYWSPTGKYEDVLLEYDWYWDKDQSGTWRHMADSDNAKGSTTASGSWYLELPQNASEEMSLPLRGYQTNKLFKIPWHGLTISRVSHGAACE